MRRLARIGPMWDKSPPSRANFRAYLAEILATRTGVIEPPSKQLRETVLRLRLCSPRDFRSCRGRVRRLARDLPAFDSVWIDALLQARKLTPLQAAMLEAQESEKLSVGPCVLLERLGRGPSSETFIARHRDANDRSVLKLINHASIAMPAGLRGLEELSSRLAGFRHPSVVGPHASLEHESQLVAVSRYVPGLHLAELLVRRGRVAPHVVQHMARQLVDALAAMEERDVVHGDISLTNIRLLDSGTVTLVDAGIRPAVMPELTIHAGLAPERYDTTAPELIGTGLHPSSVSDIYALGCVLWHLLAGRPPYPTGDPLAKLAAHQSKTIEDVREWAPDVSDDLANAIRAFTTRDPQRRPQSFEQIRNAWGPPQRAGRRALARFRAQFNTSVPKIPVRAASTSSRWPFFLTILFVLTGAALTLSDRGLSSELLRIPAMVGNAWTEGRAILFDGGAADPNGPAVGTHDDDSLLSLPGPDRNGVIELTAEGPYRSSRIDAVGTLTIRGRSGSRPVIIIDQTPCHVVADRLILENVHFQQHGRQDEPAADGAEAAVNSTLLLAHVQDLAVRGCSFRTAVSLRGVADQETSPRRPTSAIAWKPVDASDRSGGFIELRDSVFANADTGLLLAAPPRAIEAENCLCLGRSAFLTVDHTPESGRDVSVALERVTLRQAEALLRWHVSTEQTSGGRIYLEANNCVFDIAGGSAALFQLISRTDPTRWLENLRLTGMGSLADPGIESAVWRKSSREAGVLLDADSLAIEGLLGGRFEFAGPFGETPADSTISEYQAPVRSNLPPGIDAKQLVL